MPRNGSGTYTLPTGNPVVAGTTIEASWANNTLADVATELTGSLSRSGAGGMTGPLRLDAGTSGVPGLAWGAETTTGFYRAGTNDMRLAVATADVQQWTASGTAVTGTLSASGAATLSSTLAVTGATTLTGALTLNGGIANNPTLTAGTANGVLYLDGSKVATSGSGLTFDGTNLGLGVTPSAWNSGYKAFDFNTTATMHATATTMWVGNNFFVNSGGSSIYKTSTFATSYRQDNAGNHVWFNAPSGTAGNAITFTQAMTLDASGNLGVGTASPTNYGAGYRTLAINGSSSGVLELQAAGTPQAILVADATDLQIQALGSRPIRMFTAGSERARLDASGNLGLGVTPSAWGSGIRSQQIGNYTALTNSQGGYTWLSNNAFYDTSWKYLTTNRALYYAQDTGDGGHKWYTAPSGTAGNAITFAQVMTLDSSGNLGLGLTPITRLDVQAVATAGSSFGLRVAAGTNSSDYTARFNNAAGTTYMTVSGDGNVTVGFAALATTATAGFPWIPSCAGVPTGAPTAPYTNAAALVVDTTNNRLYVRVGSTWRYASLI